MKKEKNHRYRILVVDDEPMVCRATVMLLKHAGHEVHAASSGEEALEIFAQGMFDLVLTDNSMEGMSGGQLAVLVKKCQPEQLVVMMTASTDLLDISAAMTAGVEVILNKPFTRDELLGVITQVMSGKAADSAGNINIYTPPEYPRNQARPG